MPENKFGIPVSEPNLSTMRFNDEAKTLVTVIFEPANSTHSSHVDVVPCQYTAMEIKKLKRDGHL